MPSRSAFIVFLALILSASVLFAGASSIPIDFGGKPDKNGVPEGWNLKVKKGDADFRVFVEEGEHMVYFKSVKASFSFQRDIALTVQEYPYLTFKWKAIRLPDGGDVRKGKTNDQALQTLVAFEGGKVLSYVWDASAPENTATDESVGFPINISIKVLTLKSGSAEAGKWVTLTRNVLSDYRRLFGSEPPPVKGVRVQINSQHTGTTAESSFGRMVFSKTP